MSHSFGAGLGEPISIKEGRERLLDYASLRPIESWAGPVASAGEVEATLGIQRSTLNKWQQRLAVVGLPQGDGNLVYPIEQFVDGRPLEGIVDILLLAPSASAGWLWLRQEHGALAACTPLQFLKSGRKAELIIVAERDFA